MRRTGSADLPLHSGHAPRWLWYQMVDLSRGIVDAIVEDRGPDEVLRRVADPFWFQAFCCVIGFDWHSSGTTTTGTGALRVAIDPQLHGLGVAGGKGRASRQTGHDLVAIHEHLPARADALRDWDRASILSAKVDNTCVQDGYQLYHHAMFVSETGHWAVVQQGMGETHARRYHWLSDGLESFVEEPHTGIACDSVSEGTLDMTARASRQARAVSLDLVRDGPDRLRRLLGEVGFQPTLDSFGPDAPPLPHIQMPHRHAVLDLDISARGWEVLKLAYELQVDSYEDLVYLRGMGPKKVRALALVADVVYGAPTSWKDPVKYSFAHGGKDGFPFPVDRDAYQSSVDALREAVESARLGDRQRVGALQRLADLV